MRKAENVEIKDKSHTTRLKISQSPLHNHNTYGKSNHSHNHGNISPNMHNAPNNSYDPY